MWRNDPFYVGSREARALRRRLRRRDAMRGALRALGVVGAVVAFGLAWGACAHWWTVRNEPAPTHGNPLVPYDSEDVASIDCACVADPWQCEVTR
jgi:hypothetical protein